jgi:hypothetical protein
MFKGVHIMPINRMFLAGILLTAFSASFAAESN